MSGTYARRGRSGVGVFIIGVAVLMVAMVIGGIVLFVASQKQQDRTITVCGKESVNTQDGGHEYRVYAADDTYVMADNLLGGARFDTANAYGKLKVNTTYNVRIKGLRIPIASQFPNILKYQEVPASEQHPELCTN